MTATRPGDDEVRTGQQARRLRPVTTASIGVAAAILGFLPWLITGMRLPLQNLWASEAGPDQMPIALLPFSQYAITLIPGLIVVGCAIAGITARATGMRQSRHGILALSLGAAAVHLIATVQTTLVVASGLQARTEAGVYLAVLVAVAILAVLVGQLVLWLIASAPAAGAVIGVTLAAVLLGPWLTALIATTPLTSGGSAWSLLMGATRWLPAVLIGAAIAWMGVGSARRVVTVLASVLLLWTGPTFLIAAGAAAGTRILLPYPREMLEYGLGVFRDALFMPAITVRPILVMLATAAIGLLMRWLMRWFLRRRQIAVAS